MTLLKLWDSSSIETVYTRASTLLSWVALRALGFVSASVRARTGGCGSGSSLTPPRVQKKVSPRRVEHTTSQQRPTQQTISSHLTPNSHRIQHTPHRRAVTPSTPHVMVRRSAGQHHNLSQDMIDETINQANHCFSISTKPEPKNKVKKMAKTR
jgi:hypothetical protein